MVHTQARRFNKLRPIQVTLNYIPHAEGSALFRMGKTTVLCVASIEERVPPFLAGTGKGWITADYAMLPRAGVHRSPRNKVASGGRAQEIQRLIGRSLRAVVDLEELGERTILIDCDVLQADGGTRTASVNGAYIALYQALVTLRKGGMLTALPLRDSLGAVSVGIVDGKPCLDLDYSADSRADMDMNVVMTGTGKFVEVQGTAEGRPFSPKELSRLLGLAQRGIRQIIHLQHKLTGSIR